MRVVLAASTRTPGPGTRSASAVRPTRAATCGSAARTSSGRARALARGEALRPRTRSAARPSRRAAMSSRGSLLKGVDRCRATTTRAWLLDSHRRGLPNAATMRRYADGDEVDLVIVGAGAGGVVLAQRLARPAGGSWCSRRARSGIPDATGSPTRRARTSIYWTDKRIIGGEDPVEMGKNNSGRGVGGSMVHFAGYTPRFHPSDFAITSRDGVGADWPISYEDLKPHYERVERELPVAGQDWPWGDRTATRTRRTRLRRRGGRCGRAPDDAASRCASGRWRSPTARSATGRTASTAASACRAARSTPRPARSSPICPTRIEHGVEVRADSMALRIEVDEASGRCTRRARYRAATARERLQRATRRRGLPATRSRRRGCC